MASIDQARAALVARILQGNGVASATERRAAFDASSSGALAPLVHKVVRAAKEISDDDFAAARATGASEDALFEVVVCAAVGEATRQLDGALAALRAAEKKG